jgi:purine-binding chemotaxis protein CheW
METTDETRDAIQYLTFRVRDEEYAISILHVREILPFTTATRLPKTLPAIRGLINLRGGAVPVVDLALAFDLPAGAPTKRTCVIVVDVMIDGEGTMMGVMADAVNDVIALRADEIEPTPRFAARVPEDFLQGMAKIGSAFVPILDVQTLLSAPEFLCHVGAAAETTEVEGAPLPESIPDPEPEAEPARPARGKKAPR